MALERGKTTDTNVTTTQRRKLLLMSELIQGEYSVTDQLNVKLPDRNTYLQNIRQIVIVSVCVRNLQQS
jgi:hypothetical protein